MQAVGFNVSYNDKLELRSKTHWDDRYRNSWREYFLPELTAHSKETAEAVNRLEALDRKYALKIWAGEASEEVTLFETFAAELRQLLT